MLGFGLIFCVASAGGLLIAMPAFREGGLNPAGWFSSGNIGSLIGGGLFSLAFLVVGTLIVIVGMRPLLARTRVTRPEVSLSTLTPRVGEVITLSYQQSFRSATEVKGIAYQLILRERATYRRGTDTVTVRHDNLMQEYQAAGRHFAAGESFQEQRQFQVPAQGIHSFDAPHNKLDWLIHVRVEMAGWPAFEEEYPLRVLPEMAV